MGTIATLKEKMAEVVDLQAASNVLNWDQQTYMPRGGAAARAEQLATLDKVAHEKAIAPEVGQLLEALTEEMAGSDPDSDDVRLVRMAKRAYDKQVKIPSDLVARISRATIMANEKWMEARTQSDFALFAPALSDVLALNLEVAEHLGYEESPYDALLDNFEPEMKLSQVQPILAELREGLVPIVARIAASPTKVDKSFLEVEYNLAQQEAMTLELLKGIGYDFNAGRQDKVAHPFTTTFSIHDVRVTNRFLPKMPTAAIFGAIHEGGHALYNQGVAAKYERTVLGHPISSALHESQSRLFENVVGRSREFWQYWFPRYQTAFPEQLGKVSPESFWRAVNFVAPSPIRVEADEVTYNLHIILRFELEVGLVEGAVKVEDLPVLWNERMRHYLGFTPKNDAEGVLQDVHWSWGYFGYFPTYSLGNLLAVQFYEKALEAIPDLPQQYARGEFGGLLAWLREHIHQHGGKYLPTELVQRITGGRIDPQPFLRYLDHKYRQIYR
jgi:carboxypeptidase Taq